MADAGTLHIVAPGLLGPVPTPVVRGLGDVLATPALEGLLARSRREAIGTRAERLLPGVFGLRGIPEGVIAAAALQAEPAAHWYRAEFCHLRADRDRVICHGGPGVRPDRGEAEALCARFNAHFAEDGFRLHPSGSGVVLASAEALPADLPSIDDVAGGYLDVGLGGDVGGRSWRAVLNEIQMLLHGDAINTAREDRGEPMINGLWVWGGGPANAVPRERLAGLTAVHADDPTLRGAAALAGLEPRSQPNRLSAIAAAPGTVIAEFPHARDALLAGDIEGWLAAIQGFEEGWAVEARAALANGTWAHIMLHGAATRSWSLRPGDRRRFWRRRRALTRYLDTRG